MAEAEPAGPALEEFVEQMGLLFEQYGASRTVGRVLGWLMVCDPPEQTAGDLVRVLRASKASVSVATRLLAQTGLIERVARPGARSTHFRLRPEAVGTALITERLRAVTLFRAMVERALEALREAPPHRRERLEAMRRLYGFFERELADLLGRWQADRGKP